MNELFLKIINMSISASWLVLAVLILRFVLKKAPKWVNVLLWGIVAVRLICPFTIESSVSLIPDSVGSGELVSEWMDDYIDDIDIHHPDSVYYDAAIGAGREPISDGEGGYYVVTKHDQLGEPATIENTVIPVLSIVWVTGMAILALYTVISYLRLRRKVDTAVRYKDNIFQSENVNSPFVLGIIKPRIYLPFNMNGQNLEHVVAHEQAHIRRKDHWWKPLGFLLLTIHWFNPLMWLAYVLLCRDIELACDEKVIKELGNEQRADYTQALVACSVNRRMIAACPLAFGEVGVKERVKSVMNYKKPAFWIVVLAVAICIIVAICFLTNPAAEREFPINGRNVSTLDTERVVEMIAKAEKLDDGSQLCVNDDNFDLMFTSDFEWANDGAIRFFYLKNQETYSAQLRMFHDDNKYFITDSSEWVEQEQFFKLIHYLDALKYMPQEEIRKLSPDADGFSVYMRNDGVPGDYNRVLKYSQNGVEDIDGWYIHLEVQPLHEVEGGAYNGSGDELIHLFYGHPDLVMLENNTVTKWFDYLESPSKMNGELSVEIPEYPGVTFKYTEAQIIASKPFDDSDLSGHTILIDGMPIWNAYFTDLTGDSFPEVCATYTWGSGIIDSRIVVCDYVNGASYELSDRGNFDFTLRYNEADGYLYVDKTKYNTDELVESGRLVFKDDCLQVEGFSSNTDESTETWDLIPMVMVNGTLYLDTGHESTTEARCGVMDGEITSQVDGSKQPTIDDQSNFGTGYGYQYGATVGTIELFMNGKWWIFATEEARQEIQFPTTETVFDFSFAGNTSGGQIMELTEDKHYWCIAVVNEGTSGITIDVAGVIYKVEAGATGYIYPDEAWAPGTYSVSFGCTSGSGMKGYAICNISSVPIIEKEPLAVRLTE